MTLGDVLTAFRARWWLVLIGLLLTTWAVLYVVDRPGVYWAQSDVSFLQPTSPTQPNTFTLTQTRVIEVASVIQREIDGVDSAHVVSDGVTIVDEGIRSGVEVRLPNAGGQWANNFNRPALDVVVVESTPGAVAERMSQTLDRIDQVLHDRQADAGVLPGNRVTTQRRPNEPFVQYASGNKGRAAAATAAIGLGVTWACVVLLEISKFRRPRRAWTIATMATPKSPRW